MFRTVPYGAGNQASTIGGEHESQPTNPVRGFVLISQSAVIAATRFGLGARPGDLTALGPDAKGWLKAQFGAERSSLIEDDGLPSVQEGLAGLLARRQRAVRRRRQGGERQAPSAADLEQQRRELRQAYLREIGARTRFAMATPDPFRERMVRFWSNHFSVTQGKGTDHGTASVALLVGGAVKGGRVIADWPGLDRLFEGRDIRPTVDLRSLFAAVLRDHLGVAEGPLARTVFPDSRNLPTMTDLFRLSG